MKHLELFFAVIAAAACLSGPALAQADTDKETNRAAQTETKFKNTEECRAESYRQFPQGSRKNEDRQAAINECAKTGMLRYIQKPGSSFTAR